MIEKEKSSASFSDGEGACQESERPRIRRLPEAVVNRIAAGEVVVRPSAALKELLENSIDAGATSITVTVRDGGLKLLQVCDDGKGIALDDLELLCERFATSKLERFEDLASVATFGFRGEALASISHVSRLSVLTKTRGSTVAYKASYLDGALRSDPVPTAGVDGTTITIEDMFYNLSTRKRSLKSSSEEYRAIVEVVSRYAIRYSQIAFICRRFQTGAAARLTSASDVRTDLNASSRDNIRAAFGSSVVNETSNFEVQLEEIGATVLAFVSNANFSMKKPVFILFINGRLVECQPFKRAVLAAYSCFLPKTGYPFAYFDLQMAQADVDVNVHPTKKEVRFLHNDAIIDAVVQQLISKLKTTETSRTFLTQSVIATKGSELRAQLPNRDSYLAQKRVMLDSDDSDTEMPAPNVAQEHSYQGDENEMPFDCAEERLTKSQGTIRKIADRPKSSGSRSKAIDMDYSDEEEISMAQKRTQMSPQAIRNKEEDRNSRPASVRKHMYAKDKVRTGSNAPVGLYDVYLGHGKDASDAIGILDHRKRSANAIPMLTSIQNLLEVCRRNAHRGLTEVLKDHTFVGLASHRFALLQHSTKLLLVDIDAILMEVIFQQTLFRFADHDVIHLDPPAPVLRLLKQYVDRSDTGTSSTRVSVQSCITILSEKAPLLSEYFGISFTTNTTNLSIDKLPLIFPAVMPDMNHFGEFLYHLATKTDWTQEQPCLSQICHHVAKWYGRHWVPLPCEDDDDTEQEHFTNGNEGNGQKEVGVLPQKTLRAEKSSENRREWIIRHIFFASLRRDFYPPTAFHMKKVIREITSTAKLYKVFERC